MAVFVYHSVQKLINLPRNLKLFLVNFSEFSSNFYEFLAREIVSVTNKFLLRMDRLDSFYPELYELLENSLQVQEPHERPHDQPDENDISQLEERPNDTATTQPQPRPNSAPILSAVNSSEEQVEINSDGSLEVPIGDQEADDIFFIRGSVEEPSEIIERTDSLGWGGVKKFFLSVSTRM